MVYLQKCGDVFKRIDGAGAVAHDIDKDPNIVEEIDVDMDDDDQVERVRDMLENMDLELVIYTASDDAKYVLLLAEFAQTCECANVMAFVSPTLEGCEEQAHTESYCADDVTLEFVDGACNDSLSDCGSEQYFRRIYPIVD